MTDIQIGITDLPYDRERYYSEFGVVEHRVGQLNPPNAATLRKWASQAPDEFRHIWVAWQSFTFPPEKIKRGRKADLLDGESARDLGGFQDTAVNRRVWTEIRECAEAIGADTIVLETPAVFSPTDIHRDNMRAFAQDWSALPEGTRIAWHPAGFWERDECLELCEAIGWDLVIDPLVDLDAPLPDTDHVYFRMMGAHGFGNSYGDDALDVLLEMLQQYEQATVIFRTDDSIKDATRFQKYIEVMLG